MKKLILLVIATLVTAVVYWLASPPDATTDQPVGVDSKAKTNTSGESSAEELIARYVDSQNQKNLDAFLALVHPEILAGLDTKDQKYSTWLNSAKPIVNQTFEISPLPHDKRNVIKQTWGIRLEPTHQITINSTLDSGGPVFHVLIAIESNAQWHLILPLKPIKLNQNTTVPDPAIDSFAYRFESAGLHNHQWDLSFKMDNPNDFQVLLAGDEEQILLSTRQLNTDQYGRNNLRVRLKVESVDNAESMIPIPCSIGSAHQSIGYTFRIPGNQSLKCIPVSQPTRSNREIVLGEFLVMNDGKLESNRLLIREFDPQTPEPREVFLDLQHNVLSDPPHPILDEPSANR